MEDDEGRIRQALRSLAELRCDEDRLREGGGSGEQLLAGDGRCLSENGLEELTHGSEGEVALELASARVQAPQTHVGGERLRLPEQTCLADSDAPLDDDQSAVTRRSCG